VGAEERSEAQIHPHASPGCGRRNEPRIASQPLGSGLRGRLAGSGVEFPEKVPSSELTALLQNSMYDGDSVPRILGIPLLYGLVGLIFVCIALQKAKEAWGYGLSSWAQRRQEERHGRRTKGPELSLPSRLKMFRRDGIRLKLQGESMGSKLVPWGRSYAIPKRLESSHIMLMGDTGAGKSSAIRQILRQVKPAAAAGDRAEESEGDVSELTAFAFGARPEMKRSFQRVQICLYVRLALG